MTDSLQLVLTGSRPPSARGESRQMHSRPKSGYKKVSESSDADELLFGSTAHACNNLGHYHRFSPASAESDVKWAKRVPTPKRDRPLLWAPSISDSNSKQRPSIKPALTSIDLAHKNRYRLIKHTPTFVDETLFGPKLEEPSFAAPWEDKTKKCRPFLFSSMDYRAPQGENPEPYSVDGRPPSRRGSRPNSTTRPTTVESSSGKKSVWKP